jgi:phosphoribosylaminoimidazolecarboxamide formyltransferase/IMP cyclohydrolase
VNLVDKIDDLVKVRHVLVSAFDKSDICSLAQGLVEASPSVTLYSTGGTYEVLGRCLGDRAKDRLVYISEYTGQPEMQGGLVKTLDYRIYLGLLSETYNPAHEADLKSSAAVSIDMVVSNLYPFGQTIGRPNATAEEARANIDIGGPCMIRAAAKNFLRVAVVTQPADYESITAELKDREGCLGLTTRFALAQKAFAYTAEYEKTIAAYWQSRSYDDLLPCYRIVGKDIE